MDDGRIKIRKRTERLWLVTDKGADEALAREALRSKDALGALCERYISRIYGFVLRRTGDIQDAEDLTLSVFEKVVANIEKFDSSRASFSTWIYRIALNTLNDYFRAKKRKRDFFYDFQGSSKEHAVPALDDGVNMKMDILRLVGELPAKYREVIELRYFAGLKVGEIAEILRISETAASKRILRGLERLRLSLSGEKKANTVGECHEVPQE